MDVTLKVEATIFGPWGRMYKGKLWKAQGIDENKSFSDGVKLGTDCL
jgi:hypothetical protein